MRKNLFLVFLLLLVIFVWGCEKDQNRSALIDSDNSDNVFTHKKTKLTMMFYYEGQERFALMDKLCNGFNESQKDIEVIPVFVPFKDFKKRILAGYAQDVLPDIIILDNPDHAFFADMGILMDITDDFESCPDKDKYFKGSLMSCTYKDRLYGVPLGNNSLALFYNKEMLEEAKVEPPKTWAELKTAAKKLSTDNVKGIDISAPNSEEGTFQFMPWLLSAGGSIERLNSPESIKAFSFLADLIKDGSMRSEVINWTQFDIMKRFAAGKTAMMINGSWQLKEANLSTSDIDYGVVKFPMDKKYASVLGGENLAITKGENQDNAFKFLLYVSKPENIKWYSNAIGYFPPRKDIELDSSLTNNPAIKVFSEQMQYATPRGPHPKWPEISGIISQTLQEVLIGMKTPESAANDAQSKLDKILK